MLFRCNGIIYCTFSDDVLSSSTGNPIRDELTFLGNHSGSNEL